MTEWHSLLIKLYREQLAELEQLRHRATYLCVNSPLLWVAMHGIPLSQYHAELDRLRRTIEQQIATIEAGERQQATLAAAANDQGAAE